MTRNVRALVGMRGMGLLLSLVTLLAFAAQPAQATPVFTNIATTAMGDVNATTNGSCWADFDGDGDPDLWAGHEGNFPSRLWRNDGSGSFTDVAGSAGLLSGNLKKARGCAWADLDNDGDPDLIVAQAGSIKDTNTARIYENDGDGTFTDRTTGSGISRLSIIDASVSVADTDGDGDHDVTIAARHGRIEARFNGHYRQDSPFTFTDIGPSNGLADPAGPQATFLISWFDYDSDGDVDPLVEQDFWGSELYRNDAGVMTRVTSSVFPPPSASGGTEPDNPMGASWADYDNDGDFDLVISGMDFVNMGPSLRTTLYQNNGDGTFSNVTDAAGLMSTGNVHWDVEFADLDNDGDKDLSIAAGHPQKAGVQLAMPNTVYVNQLIETGTATFIDQTDALGLRNVGASWGAAWADINHDGKLDWWLGGRKTASRLFLNGGGGNAIMVRPVGSVQTDAVGAWVRIKVGTSYRYDHVRGLDGYQGQSLVPVHFGLGSAELVDEVAVRWPGETSWSVACTLVGANQTVVVVQGGACTTGPL